jgi:hypothetical protein
MPALSTLPGVIMEDFMSDQQAALDEVVTQARRLSPLDKIRLVERLMAELERDLAESSPAPSRSLYGIWSDLGPAPSAAEIDEARREAWANFPREDIA